jgi:hypothetical protein
VHSSSNTQLPSYVAQAMLGFSKSSEHEGDAHESGHSREWSSALKQHHLGAQESGH